MDFSIRMKFQFQFFLKVILLQPFEDINEIRKFSVWSLVFSLSPIQWNGHQADLMILDLDKFLYILSNEIEADLRNRNYVERIRAAAINFRPDLN